MNILLKLYTQKLRDMGVVIPEDAEKFAIADIDKAFVVYVVDGEDVEFMTGLGDEKEIQLVMQELRHLDILDWNDLRTEASAAAEENVHYLIARTFTPEQ